MINRDKKITKRNKIKPQLVFVFFFSFLILGITIIDMVSSDRYFSENENRILASRPTADMSSVLDSTFSKKYEEYVTDQFVMRDSWIQIKNYMEIVLQKKELNGVYLTKDGSLIEKHSITDIDTKKALSKQKKLVDQTKEYAEMLGTEHVKIMLVPTANMILTEKLPKYTQEFQQFQYLDDIRRDLVDPLMLLRVGESLQEHNQEPIFYKTDHHWTTLGAYYGYLTFMDSLGIPPIEEFSIENISNNFLGTLHSKINIKTPYDSIYLMNPAKNQGKQYQVKYIYEKKTTESFYDMEKLESKDQYAVFFGGNYPLIQINAHPVKQEIKGKNLLIIKDSYANCFAPFAASHFENIYLLDPRYYRDNISKIIKEYEVTDVLVLYDVIHFIENY